MQIEIFKNADTFSSILNYVRTMSDTLTLYFSDERMHFQTLDASHVSIIDAAMPRAWFDKYDVVSRTPISIGINVAVLSRIVNVRDKDQLIRLVYTPGTELLDIHIVGGVADKQFMIHLVNITLHTVEIPQADYTAEMTISANALSRIVAELRMFGDTVLIECTEENVSLKAENELGAMVARIEFDNMTSYAIEENSTVSSSYSLAYVHSFLASHSKISKYVELKMTPECPLQLVYWLGIDAYMRFFLAPKLD